MKTLTFLDEDYVAERIEKGPDSIVGYNGGVEVFAFRGVSDFNDFTIDGEWDEPNQTPEAVLVEINELKKRLAAAEKTTLAMMDFM